MDIVPRSSPPLALRIGLAAVKLGLDFRQELMTLRSRRKWRGQSIQSLSVQEGHEVRSAQAGLTCGCDNPPSNSPIGSSSREPEGKILPLSLPNGDCRIPDWANCAPLNRQRKAQIDKLQRQAEAMRQKQVSKVVAELKKTIAEYELSAADLGLAGGARRDTPRKPRRAGSATVGVAKYRNPQSGDTWTGRGRPPAWIVGAKDRDAFLIDGRRRSVKPKVATTAKQPKTVGKRARGRATASAGTASA